MLTGLILDVYAPPLRDDDARPERAARAIEETYPAIRLICELQESPDGPDTRILHESDRESYLRSDDGNIPFITTPGDDPVVTLQGFLEPEPLGPGQSSRLHVLAELPDEPVFLVGAAEVLERMSRALDATWAMLTPAPAHAVIVDQVIGSDSSEEAPQGLPRLRPAWESDDARIPQRLGWLNYWPDALAAALGFPDPARDAAWMAHSRHVNGAWLVQLTPEALDLERADHRTTLSQAYARFASIGRV